MKIPSANRAMKYRVYTTKDQAAKLNLCFAANRKAWNYMLERYWAIDEEEKGLEEKTSFYDRIKRISREQTTWKKQEEQAWLYNAPARSKELMIQNNLKPAFDKWFKALKIGDVKRKRAEYISRCKKTGKTIKKKRLDGFFKPKFKSWQDNQSFQLDVKAGLQINLSKGSFTFAGCGWIGFKIKQNDYLLSNDFLIKTATVRKTKSGKYYVSFSFHDPSIVEVEEMPKTRRVGVDLGVRHLLILDDGQKIPNPKFFAKELRKMKKIQRKMSRQYRMNKGKKTKNWEKTRVKLAKQHERVSNLRSDLTHKITNWLVNKYDYICIEGLSIQDMIKQTEPVKREGENGFEQTGKKYDAMLHRNVLDANFYEYRRQIEYKAKWRGKSVFVADKTFPSTKKCYICKEVNQSLDLKKMPPKWICPSCGNENDIDVNAALNLLEEGEKALGQVKGLIKL